MLPPPTPTVLWASIDDIPVVPADMLAAAEWRNLLAAASHVLWAATGRRWRGVSTAGQSVLRAAPPPSDLCGPGWGYHPSWGVCPCYGGVSATGVPLWGRSATHRQPRAVRLPAADLTAVTAVVVDGEPFDGWQLDGHTLSRVDGQGWPVCGERTQVDYLFGRPAPAGGREACVELAVELARSVAAEPDRPCQLPRRLQSVTRQGLTFAALDDLDFLDKGLTGMYGIDLWIRAVNPHGRPQAGSVWSPDLAFARRA